MAMLNRLTKWLVVAIIAGLATTSAFYVGSPRQRPASAPRTFEGRVSGLIWSPLVKNVSRSDPAGLADSLILKRDVVTPRAAALEALAAGRPEASIALLSS